MKILEIRILPGEKVLKGFADIEFHNWIIKDFRIVKHNDQPVSVEPPKITWKESATQQIKFKQIVLVPFEDRKILEAEILSAYRRELERAMREMNYENKQSSQG